LIWTEYDETSITVKLFGTATVVGKQTGQTESALDQCTKVQTERTRTWVDGRTEVDVIGATYQPAEGIDCEGNSTIPIPECAADEGLEDSDGDGFDDLCVPFSEICSEPDTEAIDEDGDGKVDYCRAAACPEGFEPSQRFDGTIECLPVDDASDS